jgi:hypothetical protein
VVGFEILPEGASIVADRHRDGVCHVQPPPMPADKGRGGGLTLDQPRPFRDWSERFVVMRMAGEAGEFMGCAGDGYFDDTLSAFDRRQALAIARRSDRHRELRAKLDEETPEGDDWDWSMKISAALTADPGEPTATTTAHVHWLACEARDLLERHRAQLSALAAELFVKVEMKGPEIEALVRSIPCDCKCFV